MIYGSIRKLVLPRTDFEFLIAQVIHLANRRPVAFKHALRDSNVNDYIPSPITPEILIKGFELPSINIIPHLQCKDESDPSWDPNVEPVDIIRSNYDKLIKARKVLSELYHSEFLSTLVEQSTNVKERYKPVEHTKLKPGDLVILVEPFTKRSNYPMGLVTDVISNDLGEVTDVTLVKSDSGEKVRRHVTSLIPILTDLSNTLVHETEKKTSLSLGEQPKFSRPKRHAARKSRDKTKDMLDRGVI